MNDVRKLKIGKTRLRLQEYMKGEITVSYLHYLLGYYIEYCVSVRLTYKAVVLSILRTMNARVFLQACWSASKGALAFHGFGNCLHSPPNLNADTFSIL